MHSNYFNTYSICLAGYKSYWLNGRRKLLLKHYTEINSGHKLRYNDFRLKYFNVKWNFSAAFAAVHYVSSKTWKIYLITMENHTWYIVTYFVYRQLIYIRMLTGTSVRWKRHIHINKVSMRWFTVFVFASIMHLFWRTIHDTATSNLVTRNSRSLRSNIIVCNIQHGSMHQNVFCTPWPFGIQYPVHFTHCYKSRNH